MKTSIWIYMLIPTILWACDSDERPQNTGRSSRNTVSDSGSVPDTGAQNDSGINVDSSLSDGGFVMDAGLTPDAGAPQDSGQPPMRDTGSQSPTDAGMPAPGASAQIAAIRAAPDGRLNQMIDAAGVTYIKPAVGLEASGFFIQGERMGPAIFIKIDPATLSPSPSPGSLIRFVATQKETSNDRMAITAIDQYQMLRAIVDVATLVQDISSSSDIITNLDSFESEIIRVNGQIKGIFSVAGQEWVSAQLSTMGLSNEPALQLRLPVNLQRTLGLSSDCQVRLSQVPVWRFQGFAQIIVMEASEISVTNCPRPQWIEARAQSNSRIIFSANQHIQGSSVQTNGGQVRLSPQIGINSALTYKTNMIVTTDPMTSNTNYTATLGTTITNQSGQLFDPNTNTQSFTSISDRPILRINELNLNISSGCDLVELRVLVGGNLDGYVLQSRGADVVDLTGLSVQANDYIVVHLGASTSACNPNQVGNETTSVTQHPKSLHALNFDQAYDWYSGLSGLARTDAALTILDTNGLILDAVLLSDDPTGTAASASETAAEEIALAGEWTTVNRDIPANGYYDSDFCMHAVQDLDGTSTTPAGTSIQRLNDEDRDNLSDWTDSQTASWGRNNLNQVNQ